MVVYSDDGNKMNVVCCIACPSNCLNCEWSDTITATVCDLGKCALRTFQDTSQSNHACLSMFPLTLSLFSELSLTGVTIKLLSSEFELGGLRQFHDTCSVASITF